MYVQLANAIEKQKELQQQYEEKKVHTVELATTTEPQHMYVLYIIIYVYKFFNIHIDISVVYYYIVYYI